MDELNFTIIHGITMIGTIPTFYKIPITSNLLDAVHFGRCPEQETIIHALIPATPAPFALG